jgi:hypothetical protein
MTAFITKLAALVNGMTARWAGDFQSISTFCAELGPFSILELAFWAFHGLAIDILSLRSSVTASHSNELAYYFHY